ncbi:hypothetical protein BDF21DRAFT_404092 [Thamnidium elegans]|nr:hypothetical protein BDF21DRAFT_404095 [Thamnidium elegans]KAI8053642.1 hypothetical protein BDF21DRAFT_404092 [Thamnidium elegans]
MSTFNGHIREYPILAIDCFIPNDSKQYFILSHVHKDHAHGLENPNFKEKVYCTEQTALLLPFMEKHTSKQFMYSHLEGLMVSVPYFETILRHNSTKITFLPANHNLDYLKGFRIKNLYMDTTCCYAEKRNFISKQSKQLLMTDLPVDCKPLEQMIIPFSTHSSLSEIVFFFYNFINPREFTPCVARSGWKTLEQMRLLLIEEGCMLNTDPSSDIEKINASSCDSTFTADDPQSSSEQSFNYISCCESGRFGAVAFTII